MAKTTTTKENPVITAAKKAFDEMGEIIVCLNVADETLTATCKMILNTYPKNDKEVNKALAQLILDRLYKVPQLKEAIGKWLGCLGIKSKDGKVTRTPKAEEFDTKKLQGMASILKFKPAKKARAEAKPKKVNCTAQEHTIALIEALMKRVQETEYENAGIKERTISNLNDLITYAKQH